jgi:hypothetical protein
MVAGQFISVPTPQRFTSKLTQKEREMMSNWKWQKGAKELESALASLTIENSRKNIWKWLISITKI